MSIQRPTYYKNGLGYLFNISTKKPKIRSDPKDKDISDDKIESSKSFDKPIEIGQERSLDFG